MVTPVLQTDNFLIRAFERRDLELFARYRSHEIVAKYQSWTSYTYQDAVEIFENMDYSTFGTKGNWYQLAISTIKVNLADCQKRHLFCCRKNAPLLATADSRR